MTGTMQNYPSAFSQPHYFAQPQSTSLNRHDSLLLPQHVSRRHVDSPGEKLRSEQPRTSPFVSSPSRATSSAISKPKKPTASQQPDSFRFLVTTNPTQFKDKAEMRENRKHVMKDFLRKERHKAPGTRDIRAEDSVEVGKRRRLESNAKRTKQSVNLTTSSRVIDTGVLTPQSSNDGTSSSLRYGSDTESTVMTIASRTASQTPRYANLNLGLMPRSIADEEVDEEYPECDSGGTNLHSVSCSCCWPDQEGTDLKVPDLFSILGFKISPYHSWLQSANTAVDLEKLKYACGRRLRSCSMAKAWLPNLIRARHSFLSTICISAAHDEAMQRIVFGSESLSPRGSKKAVVYERLAVKSEVIAMINASLNDPDQMISDATIIAVLNIFNSEIIGCDVDALKTHQQGLTKMISMRGGLDKLGVLGHMARTISVTMLVGTFQRLHAIAEIMLILCSAFRPLSHRPMCCNS